MIGRPGSTLWLLGHEIRLTWRNMRAGRGGRVRLIVLGIAGLISLAFGVPLAFVLRHVPAVPVNPYTIVIAAAACVVIFTLMLSQTLAGSTEALYTRGDLDLLFSSPLSPRKTLTVRFLALAASAFMTFGALLLPFLLPVAIIAHWQWLGALLVLASLALAASAVSLALAVFLFALIGPRRTRAVAQILAAIIGAAFFLASQTRTLFGARGSSMWVQVMQAAADPRLHLPGLVSWPLRAATGEPLPLLAFVGGGGGLFLLVSTWLSRRFAADAAAAQGADVGVARTNRRPIRAFASGAFAATIRKELRLLVRDIALLAQVLLRVLYLLPATLLLLRNAGEHESLLLPGGAAALTFLAGQVAGSLTWVTLSAEDAPELLACAPAPAVTVRNAKLVAGLLPLAVLLVGPLIALTVLAPLVGFTAFLGASASALASGFINAWHPSPGKRSEFRRRRAGSMLTGWAMLIVSVLIGAATALAGAGGWFSLIALIPAIIAALALAGLHRSPAKVAEVWAAAS